MYSVYAVWLYMYECIRMYTLYTLYTRQRARDSACVLYTSKMLAFAVAFAVSRLAVSGPRGARRGSGDGARAAGAYVVGMCDADAAGPLAQANREWHMLLQERLAALSLGGTASGAERSSEPRATAGAAHSTGLEELAGRERRR